MNDEKIDVIYRGSVIKGNSVEITLEIDDLLDAEKGKKLLDARFTANNRVSIIDILAVYLYIRAENKKREEENSEEEGGE